jgi:hypothetical protein
MVMTRIVLSSIPSIARNAFVEYFEPLRVFSSILTKKSLPKKRFYPAISVIFVLLTFILIVMSKCQGVFLPETGYSTQQSMIR